MKHLIPFGLMLLSNCLVSPRANATLHGVNGVSVIKECNNHKLFSQDGSDLIGVMKSDGTTICEPVFKKFDEFSDRRFNIIALGSDSSFTTILTNNGLYQTPAEFNSLESASSEIIKLRNNNNLISLMYINNGEILLPYGEYTDIDIENEGNYIRNKDNKWGVINEDFSHVNIPAVYEQIDILRNASREEKQIFVVTAKGKKGAITGLGKTIIEPGRYNDIIGFGSGLLIVKNNDNQLGAVKETGKMLIAPTQSVIIVGFNNVMCISDNNIAQVYNSTGEILDRRDIANYSQDAFETYVYEWLGQAPRMFQ